MKKRIVNIISAIAFIGMLVFASGMDHATVCSCVGLFACVLWLAFFAIRKVRRQK